MNKHKKIIVTLLAAAMLFGAFVVGYKQGVKRGASNELVQLEKLGPYEEIEEVTGDKVTKDMEKIREVLRLMSDANPYFQLNISADSYQVVLLNNQGQGFSQNLATGTISVYRGDGTSVLYTDTVKLVNDITPLQMLEFGLDLVDEGVAKLYKDIAVEDGQNAQEVSKAYDVRYVDIVGYDNINKLYAKIDDEFAQTMVTGLKEDTIENSEVTLRLIYVTSENSDEISAGCNIIIDEDEYSSWNFDGYIDLYDWELGKEWFEYDYETMENTNELEKMLDVLTTDLDNMMHRFAEDNDLPDAEEVEGSDNPVVEHTEDGHYHEDGTFHPNVSPTDENPITRETEDGHYHEDGTFHPNITSDDITKYTEDGHYHEDGTFHSNEGVDNPIVRETEEGHYHEDGTFHIND